jgi:hypothetical protein
MTIRLRGVSLLTTYACPVDCPHCFFAGVRRADYIDAVQVEAALGSLTDPLGWVHLTGGEPLVDEAAFFALVSAIRRVHNGDVGVATNGGWAVDEPEAARIVGRMKDGGVTGVCVSADVFHQPRVPVDAARRAVAAVAAAGIDRHSFVVSCRWPDDLPGAAALNARSEAIARDVAAGVPIAPTTVRPLGRSAFRLPGDDPLPAGGCEELSCCLGKSGPMRPETVWLDPFGNVMICYGVAIGNLANRSLAAIAGNYDPTADPLIRTLAGEGPRGLYRMAAEAGRGPEGPFADPCALCYAARRALRPDHKTTLTPDECYPFR